MGRFPVTPEKERDLFRRIEALGLREADFEVTFRRGSGPGGQHANKNATAVTVTHPASGRVARSGESRSQGLNRFLATRRLVELIEADRRRPARPTPPESATPSVPPSSAP